MLETDDPYGNAKILSLQILKFHINSLDRPVTPSTMKDLITLLVSI